MAASRRGNPEYSRSPNGYYFVVQTDPRRNQIGQDGETEVYFTSATYFDREGAQSDWHVGDYVGHILEPLGLIEDAEGMCVHQDGTPEALREQLLQAGFRESPAFTAHLRETWSRMRDLPPELPPGNTPVVNFDQVVGARRIVHVDLGAGPLPFEHVVDNEEDDFEEPEEDWEDDFSEDPVALGDRITPEPAPRGTKTLWDRLNEDEDD